MAPWRRIGRREFGIALAVVTLPGLLFMLIGWGSGAGSWLEPLMGFMGAGQDVSQNFNNSGDLANLQLGLERLQSMATGAPNSGPAVEAAAGFDWGGLLNGLLSLALIPLCRMRLRDMGWFGWQEMALIGAMYVDVVAGLGQVVTGVYLLPLGWLWGLLNFGGLAWLTFAKGQPRLAVHERIPGDIHDH